MKREYIRKIILATIISTTLSTLAPVTASAGWVNDYQSNWYYMLDNKKVTGWKRIDGQLYYFDSNGKMQTGWIKAGKSWYFLASDGILKTGWINYNKKVYYTDSSGAMQTGIINVEGKVYIFDDNGVMKTSNTVMDGQFYTIGSDGVVAGSKTPTPEKEFDSSGNCVTVLKNTNNTVTSPTESSFDDVIEDKTDEQAKKEEDYNIKYSLKYKDSTGELLKTVSVKKGKSEDLYEPTKDGYVFKEWNTKSDGSGKSYDSDDDVEVNKDLSLYAQWTKDTTEYVTSITIAGSSSVAIGKTAQMTAKVLPSGATNTSVTWSVSDTSKATIDSNGLLTGVANGTVTVTATAKDGSGVSSTKSVTVSATAVAVSAETVTVSSSTGATTITTSGGTLQMTASILPTDATNQEVVWSVEDGTGHAAISSSGLLTAGSNGKVTVKATVTNADNTTTVGSTTIAISGQTTTIPVTSITVTAKNQTTTGAAITVNNGTLQMSATVLPTSATIKTYKWSVDDTSIATISDTGLLTAVTNGTVTVKAIAKDGSGVVGTKEVQITGQTIEVTKITVTGSDITTDGGTSQMSADVLPTNASNKAVTWSVTNGTGSAAIDSSTGVLTAKSDGAVTVKAIAKDGSGISGTKEITISNQTAEVPVTSVTVTGTGGATKITTDDGTLQMISTLLPTYTTTTSGAVTWSVASGTGSATISSTGLLKAVSTGTVIVKATATNSDGTKVYGTKVITLSNQFVQVESITVSADADEVAVDRTLQMSAAILPKNAANKNVTWSVENGTGGATITTAGVLTATAVGTVDVIATAKDGTKVFGSKTITITPQVDVTDISVEGYAITDEVVSTTATDIIDSDDGTLQMVATVSPDEASNKEVTWSVEKAGDAGTTMTGSATITSDGILTATADGTVTVKATAKDGSGEVGSKVITISNQVIQATGFTVKGYAIIDGVKNTTETTKITADGGILQMVASVLPSNATTSPAVTWSVEQAGDTETKMTGNATIDKTTGVLTAVANGTVTVKASGTNLDGTVINGTSVITISGQIIKVTGITISGSSTVAANKSITLTASVSPTTATDKTVTWSVVGVTGTATIDSSGTLTGVTSGVVTVTATAKDGSGVSATKNIVIS